MAEFGIPYELVTPRGTLLFNPVPNPGDGYYRLSGVDGLEGGIVRSSVDPIPQADGATVFDAYRGAAYPIIRGQIKSSDLTVRRQMEDTLRAYTDALLRGDGTLKWTPTGATKRRCTVRLLEALQINGGLIKEFQLALVAGDPRVYDDVQQTADTIALTVTGGAEHFPHGWPESWGDSSGGGTVNVTNGGLVDTKPIVRVFGPIVSPSIYNVTTGKVVSMGTLAIAAGDYVEVDMQAETVELNGSPSNNLIGTVDPVSSEFWALAPGVNTIRLSGSGFTATTLARVIWRDAYI